MAEQLRRRMMKISHRRQIDRAMRTENIQRLWSLHGNVMQFVRELNIHVLTGRRCLQQRHGVAGTVHDHPLIATIVGNDGIIGHGALIGQNRQVCRSPLPNPRHVARCQVVEHDPRIRSAHIDLL